MLHLYPGEGIKFSLFLKRYARFLATLVVSYDAQSLVVEEALAASVCEIILHTPAIWDTPEPQDS